MAVPLHVTLAGGGLFCRLRCSVCLDCVLLLLLLLLLQSLILLLHCACKLLGLQAHATVMHCLE